MILLVASAIVLLIIFILLLFFRTRIRIAIELIEEAAIAVSGMISTLFFPLIPFTLVCGIQNIIIHQKKKILKAKTIFLGYNFGWMVYPCGSFLGIHWPKRIPDIHG